MQPQHLESVINKCLTACKPSTNALEASWDCDLHLPPVSYPLPTMVCEYMLEEGARSLGCMIIGITSFIAGMVVIIEAVKTSDPKIVGGIKRQQSRSNYFLELLDI